MVHLGFQYNVRHESQIHNVMIGIRFANSECWFSYLDKYEVRPKRYVIHEYIIL